jgi:uncharacterized Zn ribbon protein
MKKATLKIFHRKSLSVNPGDLVFWNDKVLVALNKTDGGILAKDCNTGVGVELSQNDEISIIKDIQIENR